MLDSYVLSVTDGASLVSLAPERVIVQSDLLPQQERGGMRGKIKGFSAASRRRLLRKFARITFDNSSGALVITLTYPEHFPSVEVSKRDLAAFRKRLLRMFPGCAAIVKLEFQERGAPHFHLFLLGVPFIHHEVIAKIWADICGYTGEEYEKHLAAGTEVRRVYSRRQAISYIAKYLGKVEQCDVEGVGRFWSVFGDFERYCGVIMQMVLSAPQSAQVARVLGKLRIASVRWNRDRHKLKSARSARGQSPYYRRTWFVNSDFLKYLFWLWSQS